MSLPKMISTMISWLLGTTPGMALLTIKPTQPMDTGKSRKPSAKSLVWTPYSQVSKTQSLSYKYSQSDVTMDMSPHREMLYNPEQIRMPCS